MNILRRAIPVFAAIALLAAACGGQSGGSSKETVTIAFIGPLTGSNAAIGKGGRNSFQLALRQANANPENKYHYESVVLDAKCEPQVAVQVAHRAGANPEVVSAVAHYCSVAAIAAVDTYHKLGLPTTIWGSVLPAVTYGNSYPEITRVDGTQIGQNQFAAQFDKQQLDVQTIAAINDTTDYGRGQYKYFSKFAQKKGIDIAYHAAVGPDTQDFSAQLSKIKKLDPDVVWFGGLSALGARLRNQMAQLGIKAIFQGTSGIKSNQYIKATGKNAEGSLAFLGGAPIRKLPGGEKFLQAYHKADFSLPPEAYGPFAYAAAKLQIKAIEKVGPDRGKVTHYLDTQIKDVQTIIGPVTFDEHGQNVLAQFTAYVVQDDRWVPWEESAYAKGKRHLPGQG